jgi:hypothetical protein
MNWLNRKDTSLLPFFVVATALVQGVLLVTVVITFGKIDKIATSKTPNLVELQDGTTVRVASHDERSPQGITTFVGKGMVALMSWNAVVQTTTSFGSSNSSSLSGTDTGNVEPIPILKPRLDEGVQAGERKVTTATWAVSFALSEDFRATFLGELAKLTPQEVFTGNSQTLLLVRHLSQPQKMGSGKWRLDMVANLVIFENGKQTTGKGIPFNKTIFVRVIDTPPLPNNATELQTTAYKARRDGLEIYKIQDLVQQ